MVVAVKRLRQMRQITVIGMYLASAAWLVLVFRLRYPPDRLPGDRPLRLSQRLACGYEDADDLDHLRSDPALKLACGHLPASGRDLCSQPTISRWENAPGLREVISSDPHRP